jgi:hypothetical protein
MRFIHVIFPLKFCFNLFQNIFFGASKKILFQWYEFMSGELIARSVSNYFNIWLVVYLPLWKTWVRQLGWWHSQYMESHKIHVPNHQPVKNVEHQYLIFRMMFNIFRNYIFTYIHQLFQYIFSEVWLTETTETPPTRNQPSEFDHRNTPRFVGENGHVNTSVKWNPHRNRWFTYEKWWSSMANC